MTTTLEHRIAGTRTTALGLVRSEWTKVRSLRSTWWALTACLVLAVGVGLLQSIDAAGHADVRGDARQMAITTQFGVLVVVLVVVALGAVTVTGEYGTGTIRSSLTVVPRRTPVLLAKAVVMFVLVFVATAVAAALAVVVGGTAWASLHRAGPSLGDPEVLAIVFGAALYLAVAAVFALAVGALVRNSAASIGVLAGVFLLLPALSGLIPALQGLGTYLPSNAGGALSGQVLAAHPLSGGIGFALFCAYTAALLAIANRRLTCRDV